VEVLIKTLFSLAALLVLLAFNLWAFRLLWQSFIPDETPDAIAPIIVVGQEDPGGQRGQAMANILLARLAYIRQEINATAEWLQSPGLPAQRERIETLDYAASLSLPDQLFEPISIEMKLAGVEVGGMISWLQGWFSRDNLLQISVERDDKEARVAGVWNAGRSSLWFKTGPSDQAIISALAYALAQREFAKNVTEINALGVGEFESLLGALNELARLQAQAAHERPVDGEYEGVFASINDLVEKAPRWRELQHVGAELAEKVGRYQRAVDLYAREVALGEETGQNMAPIQWRMGELRDKLKIAKRSEALTAPAAATVRATGWPLDALGVTSVNMSSSPTVAILGGLPLAGALSAEQKRLVPTEAEISEPDGGGMAQYVTTVVQAVQLVAPQTKFLFTPVDDGTDLSFSTGAIVAALDRLVVAEPEILLITLGPLDGAVEQRVIERAVERGIVVIVAAGNDQGKPIPFAGSQLEQKLMIVSSVNTDGQKSPFTQFDEGVFWAPGQGIPVRPDLKTQKVEVRAGTTYAAALASGIVARILAEYPDLERPKLLSTLRETSTPTKPGSGEQVLNLDAALTKLSST
jgi:hypothetical protein